MAVETLEKLGVEVHACFESWATPVDLNELEKLIIDCKATGLVSVFNDTSNGVINPISDMGKLARTYNLLFVVDNVSGLACMPFKMDEWYVDAVATASQKGLMSPVGVSFVAMSQRAVEVCKANPKRTLYVDFIDIRNILEKKGETPGSTPVSLILSVHEALNMMNEEGIENVFLRHKALSEGTKAALEALGFKLYPLICEVRSDSLSVALVPAGVSAKKLVAMLCEQFHLRIGTGLDAMADQAVRIAHMGYCYPEDMLECFAAMECILMELGYTECMGKGTAAFIKTYKELINQR
jgi:aspartate aminotransferase-like enzyme